MRAAEERLARRRGGRDGFMLVEALSALAISALLIAALLSFTGLLRRSADRAAFRVETMEASNRTVWTIASELRQATRARWAPQERQAAAATPTPTGQAPQAGGRNGGQRRAPAQDPDAEVDAAAEARTAEGAKDPDAAAQQPQRDFVFSGGPDRLIFALAPEQADGLRAPVMVAYQIDASGAVLRAEGAIRPEDKGPGAVRLGDPLKVDPGPERLRFAYMDREPSGTEVVADAWTDLRRMPTAVRIDRLDPTSGVLVGSLRVPLLLTGEPGCADPDRGFCSRAERSGEAKEGPQGAAARAGAQGGGQAGGGGPE